VKISQFKQRSALPCHDVHQLCFAIFVCRRIMLCNMAQVTRALATNTGRLGSIPRRVVPKTWKTVLAPCSTSCSALMGGCNGTLHARCCHQLVTSAAFTAKIAAWPTAQASGNGRRRPLVTRRKEYRV